MFLSLSFQIVLLIPIVAYVYTLPPVSTTLVEIEEDDDKGHESSNRYN